MAWTVQSLGGQRAGQVTHFAAVQTVSEVSLAAGTVNLATVIGLQAGPNQQWVLISFIADAAVAGTAKFNNASTNQRRSISLVVGENVRKGENSPYWFAQRGDGLLMLTDQILTDVQMIIGLI